MLDPDVVLATIVSAFQSIPALVSEMGGSSSAISGHYYQYGAENSLATAIGTMQSPSILIAYQDLLGGNFDGMTIWKHRLEAYIRPKNRAMGKVGVGAGTLPASPPHLWYLMMHSPVLGGTQNIRSTTLLSGSLQNMDTPTLMHKQDENGADFFVGSMVWPEAGDD